MRYVNKGGVDLLTQQNDLGSHLVSQLCVQVGKRLVHQEHLAVTDHGTADGNSLSLTARKRAGLTGQVLGDAQDLGCFRHLLIHDLLGSVLETQRECHVLKYGQVRIQRIVLEHHGNITVAGLEVVDHHAVDLNSTLGNVLKTCDHTQRRGFSAARRAYEYDKFLIGNIQVEVLNRNRVLAVNLLYVG